MAHKLTNFSIEHFKGLRQVELQDVSSINVLVGKNNSGKSSILHAIDIAGLALQYGDFSRFQLKLEIKDLFEDIGQFGLGLTYEDGSQIQVGSQERFRPVIEPAANDDQKIRSILIWPDVNSLVTNRSHFTPKTIVERIEARNFQGISGLQILNAIKFYGQRNERGLTPESYQNLIDEVRAFFPDLTRIDSGRTEDDIDTLFYEEYGRQLDIIYSGSGLRHFVDILVKLEISGANVVLLDEPEMGLHPDMQRRFVGYLNQLVAEKGLQIFVSTHSPIFLNGLEPLNCYRIQNIGGERTVARIDDDAIRTVMGDLGVRPSDMFNQDICFMVEGADDVVYFRHIFEEIYAEDFSDVSVGVLQYAGGAAEGIISGVIDVSNIVPAQGHVFWLRDRDSAPADNPSQNATKFINALERQGMPARILERREIEYYYPEPLMAAAQQGDEDKARLAVNALNGDQGVKFRDVAKDSFTVPRGKYMRQLLHDHVRTKEDVPEELKKIIEEVLIPWKAEITGE